MDFIRFLVACGESDVFFHAELLVLLVSIVLSFNTPSTKPFFTVSGACLFTAIAAMVYELSRGWTARMINAETMATSMLSGMLLATFGVAMVSRMHSLVVWTHVAVVSSLCVCLAIGLCTVRMDLARSVDVELDQSKLRAAMFSALHLIASILIVAESFRAKPCPRIIVTEACDENPRYRDRKICEVI